MKPPKSHPSQNPPPVDNAHVAPGCEPFGIKAWPRYFWQQNYEIGDESMHWALNDTHSTQEGKVSCCYMVLFANYPTCMDGKPLSEQPMPKRIIDLLNSEHEMQASHASDQAKIKGLTADCERIDALSELYRECPHAEIHFNDDADQEPWPVGYTIYVAGCDPLMVTKPTFREAIDALRAALKESRP